MFKAIKQAYYRWFTDCPHPKVGHDLRCKRCNAPGYWDKDAAGNSLWRRIE